jgi:S1-C subfamily serine protease
VGSPARGWYPAPLVLAALVAALALAAPPASSEPAALSVRVPGYHGSAVVWDAARGRLLTALHVVEDLSWVEVVLPSGAVARASVVARDPALDLALLQVDAPLPPARPLAAAPAAGSPAWLAGCPSLRCDARPATIAAPLRAFGGSRYVEIAGTARPGASGGAVLDERGALVGIVDLSIRRGAAALAIPVDRAEARFPRGGDAIAARGAARASPQ